MESKVIRRFSTPRGSALLTPLRSRVSGTYVPLCSERPLSSPSTLGSSASPGSSRTCLPASSAFFFLLTPSSFPLTAKPLENQLSASCCSIPICYSLPRNCLPKGQVGCTADLFLYFYPVLIPSGPRANKHGLICMPRGDIYPEIHFSPCIFQHTLLFFQVFRFPFNC